MPSNCACLAFIFLSAPSPLGGRERIPWADLETLEGIVPSDEKADPLTPNPCDVEGRGGVSTRSGVVDMAPRCLRDKEEDWRVFPTSYFAKNSSPKDSAGRLEVNP